MTESATPSLNRQDAAFYRLSALVATDHIAKASMQIYGEEGEQLFVDDIRIVLGLVPSVVRFSQ